MQKTRIQRYYESVVVEDLLLLHSCKNIMQLPKIERAVLNSSSASIVAERQSTMYALAACFLAGGQKCALTKAKKSIAAFQLREGGIVGCMCTLRRERMYNLVDKLLTFLLPRTWNESSRNISIDDSRSYRSTVVDHISYPSKISKNASPSSLYSRATRQSRRKEQLSVGIKDITLWPEVEKMFELANNTQGIHVLLSFSVCKVWYGKKHVETSPLRHVVPQKQACAPYAGLGYIGDSGPHSGNISGSGFEGAYLSRNSKALIDNSNRVDAGSIADIIDTFWHQSRKNRNCSLSSKLKDTFIDSCATNSYKKMRLEKGRVPNQRAHTLDALRTHLSDVNAVGAGRDNMTAEEEGYEILSTTVDRYDRRQSIDSVNQKARSAMLLSAIQFPLFD